MEYASHAVGTAGLIATLSDLLLATPLAKNTVVVYISFAVFAHHQFYLSSRASLTAVQSFFAVPGISAPLNVKRA